MTNIEYEVEKTVTELLGDRLDDGNVPALAAVCAAAAAELRSRLRPGVDAEELGGIFTTASAFLAIAMLSELSAAPSGASSFTAGRVSAQIDGKTAAVLRSSAETMLAQYIGGGFAFKGVSG